MSQATKRLQKELAALQKESPVFVRARPLESNILHFHFVLEGPPGSPYEGGFYHGVLKFPPQYPFQAPSIIMYTPSGRFAPSQRICMSMSDFHPESWNPVWSVSLILVGLQSFMLEVADKSLGSIESTEEEQRKLATSSLDFNVKDKIFCRLFPELVELREKRAVAPPPSGASAGCGGCAAASVAGVGTSAGGVGATSLSDAEIMALSVGMLKELLASHSVDFSGCVEKADLQALAKLIRLRIT